MKIESQDGSHMHRHVRIASKVLASASVERVESNFLAGNTYSNIMADLKFFNVSGKEVGSVQINASKIAELYDNSFDHECRIKMKYGTKISPIYA